MDIFDNLSKKIGYRRFSNREKILFVVLILLLLEFLFYNFLIRAEAQKISEVDFNEGLKTEDASYKYRGLKDFSKENLDKIALENNLNRDNFTKEGQTDIETLSISGKVGNGDIEKISSLTNYYGYSNIELNRSDENSFSYRLKAEKPSSAIYYSDLKSAYFKENEGTNIKAEDKKEEASLEKAEVNKKAEEIKNTKAPEIKNTKKEAAKEKTSASEIQNKTNIIKGHEESLSIFDDLKDNKNKVPSIFEGLDFENKDAKEYKFFADSRVRVNYYKESGITSYFVNSKDLYDFIQLGLEKPCDGISLSLLFPYDSCREIGVINSYGERIPFSGKIYQAEWFRVNLLEKDIDYIYFIPQNNEDLFFFVKEVECNEKI